MQFIKSVLSSFVFLRFTAIENDVTLTPLGVVFNSGSAVILPPRIVLLKLKFAISSLDKTNASSYINPNASFTSTVVYDENREISALVFVQK